MKGFFLHCMVCYPLWINLSNIYKHTVELSVTDYLHACLFQLSLSNSVNDANEAPLLCFLEVKNFRLTLISNS